ncbi:MAG: hypothetical protein LBG84_00160 [Treponema sp.]|jgi:hypothetical protein|nr:hypothetical protein [Treponema sp.]
MPETKTAKKPAVRKTAAVKKPTAAAKKTTAAKKPAAARKPAVKKAVVKKPTDTPVEPAPSSSFPFF